MLENKLTMAEIIIQKKRKQKNEEKEDYVHPQNLITKGYVIINYKKRIMEEKELMNHKISMMIPSDWEKKDVDWDEVYFYKSKTEKESLTLKYCEDSHCHSAVEIFQEILDETEETEIQKKMVEIDKEIGRVSYLFLRYSEQTAACVFIWQMKDGFLQGCFQIHPYRKKVWEKIIPQILQQMKRLEK